MVHASKQKINSQIDRQFFFIPRTFDWLLFSLCSCSGTLLEYSNKGGDGSLFMKHIHTGSKFGITLCLLNPTLMQRNKLYGWKESKKDR